jgi:DnaJ-class molecular chaperone
MDEMEYGANHSNKENFLNKIQKRKREPIICKVHCTLEEIFKGKIKKVKIKKNVIDNNGQRKVEQKILSLSLDQKVEGSEICFKNEGDQTHEHEPADLIFIVNIISNKQFEKEDSNLVYTKEITLVEALISNLKFIIETLDNRKLDVHMLEVIEPNTVKCIAGEGLLKSNGEKGDLLIKFKIIFPSNPLNSIQTNVLDQILN